MAKRKPALPKPSTIAMKLDYDVFAARDFSASLLEDVNDHDTALALWSSTMGDVELACAFLRLGHDIQQSGEGLTAELYDRRGDLLRQYGALQRAQKETA